jgi:hypothetical protein
MNSMKLRPHHILDILRNYGHGKAFEPHPYGHALHTVAHALLSNIDIDIELVLGGDAICRPCRHLSADGVCDDVLPQLAHPLSKQIYNDTLDQRLFAYLGMSPGCVLSLRNFLEAVNSKIPGLELLCAHPCESVQFRLDGLLQGLQQLGIR